MIPQFSPPCSYLYLGFLKHGIKQGLPDCFYPIGLDIAHSCCKLLLQGKEEEYEKQAPHSESSSVTYIFFFPLGAVLKPQRISVTGYMLSVFPVCLHSFKNFDLTTRLPTVANPHKHRHLSLAENLISFYRIHSCGQVSFYTHFASVLKHCIF